MTQPRPILAVCGKGGVGKTAFCALLSRAFLRRGHEPLCLIDADPAGGLLWAIGETVHATLADVRARLIELARLENGAGDAIERELDYRLLEALEERDGYAVLAIGRTREKGCYCPAHALLREAIDALASSFRLVLIDAEAGVEQVNRQVTRRVSAYIALVDGSGRSLHTLDTLAEMVEGVPLYVVENRVECAKSLVYSKGYKVLGCVPPDENLTRFDRQNRPLWELPETSPAVRAVDGIAAKLLEFLAKEETCAP